MTKDKEAKDRADLQKEVVEARRQAERMIDEVEEKASMLAIVNGTLRTIAANSPFNEMLRIFAANLKTLVPYDNLSVSLVDEERKVFHTPYMVSGGVVTDARGSGGSPATALQQKVMESKMPLLLNKPPREEMVPARKDDTRFIRRGYGSEAVLPLLLGKENIGTLNIACYESDKLTQKHISLLNEILPALSIALILHLQKRKFIYF